MIVVIGTMLLIAAGSLIHAALIAMRADDLLVFHWGDGRLFLFARGKGRRYDRVPVWKAPLAVVRLTGLRIRGRFERPRPAVASLPAGRPAPTRFARLA